MLKGLPYNFGDLDSLFGDEVPKLNDDALSIFKNLQDRKSRLLQRIADWEHCPESYQGKLYKKLQAMDVSRNAVISKLDEIVREIGAVKFHLQLKPTWVQRLLKQVDEIIDQRKKDQRGAFLEES